MLRVRSVASLAHVLRCKPCQLLNFGVKSVPRVPFSILTIKKKFCRPWNVLHTLGNGPKSTAHHFWTWGMPCSGARVAKAHQRSSAKRQLSSSRATTWSLFWIGASMGYRIEIWAPSSWENGDAHLIPILLPLSSCSCPHLLDFSVSCFFCVSTWVGTAPVFLKPFPFHTLPQRLGVSGRCWWTMLELSSMVASLPGTRRSWDLKQWPNSQPLELTARKKKG